MGLHSNTLHSFNITLYLETKQILFTKETPETQKTQTTCGHSRIANLHKRNQTILFKTE